MGTTSMNRAMSNPNRISRGKSGANITAALILALTWAFPFLLTAQTISNGDFEQDHTIGWTTGGRLQGTDVVERVTDGDADGDYEIRLYHYDFTEINLSQTITVSTLDVALSFDAKLRGWSSSNAQNWYGAGAVDIIYLNGSDSVLAIYRMGDITPGYGKADTPSLYTDYISDEIWHSYSINLLDEYNLHFSGFQTSDVTQIKILLWAYGSYWGGTGVGGEVFADNFIITSPVTGLIADQSIVPYQFALHQNYPNPFNPSSIVRYDLPEAANVTLVVYDILGSEVVRLVDQEMQPGYHQAVWDARDRAGRAMPTGIYIARLITPAYTKSIKMLLLK